MQGCILVLILKTNVKLNLLVIHQVKHVVYPLGLSTEKGLVIGDVLLKQGIQDICSCNNPGTCASWCIKKTSVASILGSCKCEVALCRSTLPFGMFSCGQ